MTATIILPKNADNKIVPESQTQLEITAEIQPESEPEKVISLEEFLVKPPDRMEWLTAT